MNFGRLACFAGAILCGWTFYQLVTISNVVEGTEIISSSATIALNGVAGLFCFATLGLLLLMFLDEDKL